MDRHDNFASFDNRNIPPGKPGRLAGLGRVCLLLTVLVGALVLLYVLRPEYFQFLQRYNVTSIMGEYFPSWSTGQEEDKPQPTATRQGAPAKDEDIHRQYTPEQVERAKQEVLAKKRKEMADTEEIPAAIPDPATGGSGIPVKYEYEIELYSGGRIYTDNAEVTSDAVYYEDGKGLQITLDRREIRRMIRRVKPDEIKPTE